MLKRALIFTRLKFSFIVSNHVWNFGFLDLIEEIDRIMTVACRRAMEAGATFLIQNWIMKCQWWLWFILVAIFVHNRMLVLNMYYVLLRLMGITVPTSHGVSCHPVVLRLGNESKNSAGTTYTRRRLLIFHLKFLLKLFPKSQSWNLCFPITKFFFYQKRL